MTAGASGRMPTECAVRVVPRVRVRVVPGVRVRVVPRVRVRVRVRVRARARARASVYECVCVYGHVRASARRAVSPLSHVAGGPHQVN
mgnify:CR=1 FL=1